MPIIQSVDRALKILDLFDEHNVEMTITEISEQMMLHKSTVHSLLKTLQKHHYIEQNTENGKYKLGMKLFERGNSVIHSLDLRGIAKQFLLKLSMETGLTVHLVILDGKEGVYIDKVEGIAATVLYSRIGRRVPIHSSGVGKALVAFKKPEELNKILDSYVFKGQTDNTITSEEAFLLELENIRRDGYAVDNEENEPGIYCVAVPIMNHTGDVIAAISMSMASARVTEELKIQNINLLKEASKQISRQLGYGYELI